MWVTVVSEQRVNLRGKRRVPVAAGRQLQWSRKEVPRAVVAELKGGIHGNMWRGKLTESPGDYLDLWSEKEVGD